MTDKGLHPWYRSPVSILLQTKGPCNRQMFIQHAYRCQCTSITGCLLFIQKAFLCSLPGVSEAKLYIPLYLNWNQLIRVAFQDSVLSIFSARNTSFRQNKELIVAENGRITRSELSARLQYDDPYLNNIVKKYSGLNLFSYSSVICMKEALMTKIIVRFQITTQEPTHYIYVIIFLNII